MARRKQHYEAAFEDYLRSRGLPYLAVNEHRKAIFSGARIKSFDFLVQPPTGPGLLVDIKGRKFPYTGKNGRRYWENWVTTDDLQGLDHWQQAFGDDFQSVFVFAYWITGQGDRLPSIEVHSHADRYYSFFMIGHQEYRSNCRSRSQKWQTVAVPAKRFRELAKPLPVAQGWEERPVPGSAGCRNDAAAGAPALSLENGQEAGLRISSGVGSPAHLSAEFTLGKDGL